MVYIDFKPMVYINGQGRRLHPFIYSNNKFIPVSTVICTASYGSGYLVDNYNRFLVDNYGNYLTIK